MRQHLAPFFLRIARANTHAMCVYYKINVYLYALIYS